MTQAQSVVSFPVLIVEDEPLIRMLAADIAVQEGFDALEAEGTDSAIAILEGRDDIRLIFTDIDMPGGPNGLVLAAAVHRRWPAIRLVITSGKMRPAADEMPEGSLFVPKPYTPGALMQILALAREPMALE